MTGEKEIEVGDRKLGAEGEINVDYIKSNHFRVIYIDGIHGGPAPSGKIQLGLWNQRFPIPKRVVHVSEQGVLGKEVRRDQRDAIIREVEAELLLDLTTAKQLHQFLGNLVKVIEAAIAEEAESAR